MTMRVGIYGGTFDPVHLGHINLALEIKEKWPLDEIWFVPAQKNPLKENGAVASPSMRLEMLEEAIENIPYFKICTIEIEKDTPSYTIDTIRELKEKFPRNEFYLILGDDSLKNFEKWRDPEKIAQEIPLIVGRRLGDKINFTSPVIEEAVNKGKMDTSIMEVSATTIRDRCQKGMIIEHMVPAKVVDYIYDNGLYSMD